MNETEIIERLEGQAAAFSLVGTVLRTMPKPEWLRRLADDGVFETVPYAAEQESANRGLALLGEWAAGCDDEVCDAIYDDCMHLLIGPGEPLAPPWESVYSEENQGLLFQKETLAVRRAYKSEGLEVDKLHREPDDHVGYELEFVAALAAREAEALRAGDEERAAHARAARAAFLEEHLLSWVFLWCDRMDEHAATGFYQGISALVRAFALEARSDA